MPASHWVAITTRLGNSRRCRRAQTSSGVCMSPRTGQGEGFSHRSAGAPLPFATVCARELPAAARPGCRAHLPRPAARLAGAAARHQPLPARHACAAPAALAALAPPIQALQEGEGAGRVPLCLPRLAAPVLRLSRSLGMASWASTLTACLHRRRLQRPHLLRALRTPGGQVHIGSRQQGATQVQRWVGALQRDQGDPQSVGDELQRVACSRARARPNHGMQRLQPDRRRWSRSATPCLPHKRSALQLLPGWGQQPPWLTDTTLTAGRLLSG